MATSSFVPFSESTDLPPYLAVLAVDAKGFTAEPGSTNEMISGLIPQLVGDALVRAGLRDEWNKPAFFGSTGDGFAAGLSPRVLPYLVHPFPHLLQERLAEHNSQVRPGGARLQLRVSLNVGPLPSDSENPHWTGNGRARNDTHRLLDSKPVKAILAAASAKVTFVACVFSQRVFEDVIEAGYAGLHPEQCFEVAATVEGKEFAQHAWLFVPKVSGNLIAVSPASDQSPTPPAGPSTDRPAPSVTGPRVRKNQGQVATTVESMNQNTGGAR